MSHQSPRHIGIAAALCALLSAPLTLPAQRAHVLQLDPQNALVGLPMDRGASGLRQRLLELRTTASVMQTTAHPDDEQSGLLTLLSRGTGARTALLTLNRGEAGANAAGSELFDALGALRTEELLLAGRYYGLDDQYFTAAVDYGYSKTIGEAARSWDTTAVLADMVRIIRQNRPLVVVSRWFGAERDGHGHHQLAGVLTPVAVAAAADASRFSEQLTREGLTTWRVQRLFRANLLPGDKADVVLDAARYDPWLGETYQSLGADGLARQRSQTGGRRSFSDDPAPQRLQQLMGPPMVAADDLFGGMDTSLPGAFRLMAEPEPASAVTALRAADVASRQALASMNPDAPWTVVPLLLTGVRAIRTARAQSLAHAPHTAFLLGIKEQQFERAIVAAIALRVTALAGTANADGHPAVPGDSVPVQVSIAQASPHPSSVERVDLMTPATWPVPPHVNPQVRVVAGASWRTTLGITIPPSAEPDRPHVYRDHIADNRYQWRNATPDYGPFAGEALRVRVAMRVGGEIIAVERDIRYRHTNEPEGATFPRLVVLPPVSLRVLPAVRVVTDSGDVTEKVAVEVTGNRGAPIDATVGLAQPRGGAVTPATRVRVGLGERALISFDVTLPRAADSLVLSAFARVGGREWHEEVSLIAHRDLEPAYVYATPALRMRRVPVTIAPDLNVAYIMGVGDLVPDAIRQLGARVALLGADAVSAGSFDGYDALVIGTRAYAVRPELAAATPAILSWARRGGNVVVLYQTQEFRPETMAPYPAALPGNAEETTEEDAAVRLLSPGHPLATLPNTITERDFDGWIEQRGSKFLTQLSPEYTSLVETHDAGQSPQQGVWVTARVGTGRWTYVALALHRQLPYAVPGAFRILANLLSRASPP